MHQSRTLQSRTYPWLSSWLTGQGNSLHCTSRPYGRLSTEQPSSVRYDLKSLLLFPLRSRRSMQTSHLFSWSYARRGILGTSAYFQSGLASIPKRHRQVKSEGEIILRCCFNTLLHESPAGWFLWCPKRIVDLRNGSTPGNSTSLCFSGSLFCHCYLYLQNLKKKLKKKICSSLNPQRVNITCRFNRRSYIQWL